MPEPLDFTNCDREPIHIPGSIQPHGLLLVADANGIIRQISASAGQILGREPRSCLNRALAEIIPPHGEGTVNLGGRDYEETRHSSPEGTIYEFEPVGGPDASTIYSTLSDSVNAFRSSIGIRDLAETVASHIRNLCGFDRVMVYRFLADETGTVVAEAKADHLHSYEGQHFPASDIPNQARALYVRNWTRLVADVNYTPSPILSTGENKPLDLSDCSLRSVSPIHVQYLKNMGVRSSMSISLVKDDKLWGLIACHHMSPWYGSKKLRESCELIGQIVSLQIGSLEHKQNENFYRRGRAILKDLGRGMSDAESAGTGLVSRGMELLDLVNATGAAVIEDGKCHLIGATPSTEEIQRIVRWIGDKCWKTPFAVNSLSSLFPEAQRYTSSASGLLAICHSRAQSNHVIWFRPELVQTVTWAGNPDKAVTSSDAGRGLEPRSSFEAWQETVRNQCKPWSEAEISVAADLRILILEAELTSLNTQLERRVDERTSALQRAVDELNGFTYSVSHDLRTPLRGMVGNSRIILEEYGEEVSRPIRERLLSIESNALKMANLVDDLLRFARLGRQDLRKQQTNLSRLARVCAERLESHSWPCEKLDVEIEEGMSGKVDPNLMEMVYTILIENGCKYRTADQDPQVRIGKDVQDGVEVFFVKNRGIGFEMQYAERVFRPFERLHRDGEYPGTGIGLANAKRIIERHGGRIWAEGRPGEGATFYFTI